MSQMQVNTEGNIWARQLDSLQTVPEAILSQVIHYVHTQSTGSHLHIHQSDISQMDFMHGSDTNCHINLSFLSS